MALRLTPHRQDCNQRGLWIIGGAVASVKVAFRATLPSQAA